MAGVATPKLQGSGYFSELLAQHHADGKCQKTSVHYSNFPVETCPAVIAAG
jgi:hypothetical protein